MIRSPRNKKLQDIRRLRRRKGSRALLEGTHLVEEALAAGLRLETVLVSPDYLAGPEARRLLPKLAEPPLEVTATLLAGLCDADAPRGLLAVASLPAVPLERLPIVSDGVYVYLEAVQDPANLGAGVRVAEAAGVAALILGPQSTHHTHPRALRASAGSLLRLPVVADCGIGDLLTRLESLEPRLTALVPRGGKPLYDEATELAQGCLVVALGAEGAGLTADLAARADLRLTAPMASPVESLNLAVAAGLVLYEVRRRRKGWAGSP